MATREEVVTTSRIPLSRDRVLQAAMDFADAHGIDSLSMRKLGQELGVEAMSLYNHVANKDDLLNGIVDIVVAEIWVPSKGDAWKPAMRRRAISAREMLTRHPWASGLIESSVDPSLSKLRYTEAVLACLRDAGFSVAMAVHAFSALDSYIYGFALQERSLPFGTTEELVAMGDRILQGLPPGTYPALREVVTEFMRLGYDYADEFEFGLDVILDGFERLLASARPD
jgi:AcrR family transcriptional regulator